MLNVSGALRERILNSWFKGDKGLTIAKREKLRFGDVCGIVKKARDGGDPRAVDRGAKKLKQLDELEAWPMFRLRQMDAAFRARMQAAIDAGAERDPLMGPQ